MEQELSRNFVVTSDTSKDFSPWIFALPIFTPPISTNRKAFVDATKAGYFRYFNKEIRTYITNLGGILSS
jgi:hypothetical protein